MYLVKRALLRSLVLLGLLAFSARCELPDGLFPADWIETKGGHIRTGVTQAGASLVELDCVLALTELNHSKRRLMGFDGSGPKNYFGVNTTNHFDIWHASKIEAEANVKYRLYLTQTKTTTTLYIYDHASGELLETLSGNSKGINSSECHVFTINGNSNYLCYGIRVYNFKVSIDGDLKRDLTPVYDTVQGKAAMYDSVSQTAFYAYGTGKLACNAFKFQYGSGDTAVFCDEGCLYLPSHVSYSDMNGLVFPEGTSLSGTLEGRSLTVGTDEFDLHEIFGEMQPGVKYDLKVDYEFGFRTNFFIAKSANIAALYVTLDDHDVAYLNKSKKNECTGAALKIKADGTSSGLLQIKKIAGRGNATWTYSGDKKPYKINLNEKYALIDGCAKNKKFALLSLNLQDNKDRCGLKEYVAKELADSLGMGFVPDIEFVDLYINGSYRGFYLMKERVTVGADRININEPKYVYEDELSTTRIVQKNGIKGVNGATGDPDDGEPFGSAWNIPNATVTVNSEDDSADPALAAGIQAYQYATDSQLKGGKEGGVVLEMNVQYGSYAADEHILFVTRRGQIFTMKAPESATQAQVQKAAIYMQEFEDALFDEQGFNALGRHYSEYIDVESMARHVILDGFMMNSDFCLLSTFFFIDADPATGEYVGKLIAEPPWDYDFSRINTGRLYAKSTFENHYVPPFLLKADFTKAMYELNSGSGFQSTLTELIGTKMAALSDLLRPAHELNYLRWGSDSLSDVTTIRANVASRKTNWNNIWNDSSKLFGAWIAPRRSAGSVTVEIYGTPSSIQWYKLDTETSELVELQGETETSVDLKAYGSGDYVCGVRGKSLEPNVSGTTSTIYTSPYNYPLPEPALIALLLALGALLRRRA